MARERVTGADAGRVPGGGSLIGTYGPKDSHGGVTAAVADTRREPLTAEHCVGRRLREYVPWRCWVSWRPAWAGLLEKQCLYPQYGQVGVCRGPGLVCGTRGW